MQYFFCCVINCSCEIIAISCTVPFAISCTVAFAISCTVTFTVVHLVLNLRFPLSLLHCHAPLFHRCTPLLSPSYTFAFTAPSYTFGFTARSYTFTAPSHHCTLLLDLNSQPSHAMPLHVTAFAWLPATIHKPTAIHKLDSHQASSSWQQLWSSWTMSSTTLLDLDNTAQARHFYSLCMILTTIH